MSMKNKPGCECCHDCENEVDLSTFDVITAGYLSSGTVDGVSDVPGVFWDPSESGGLAFFPTAVASSDVFSITYQMDHEEVHIESDSTSTWELFDANYSQSTERGSGALVILADTKTAGFSGYEFWVTERWERETLCLPGAFGTYRDYDCAVAYTKAYLKAPGGSTSTYEYIRSVFLYSSHSSGDVPTISEGVSKHFKQATGVLVDIRSGSMRFYLQHAAYDAKGNFAPRPENPIRVFEVTGLGSPAGTYWGVKKATTSGDAERDSHNYKYANYALTRDASEQEDTHSREVGVVTPCVPCGQHTHGDKVNVTVDITGVGADIKLYDIPGGELRAIGGDDLNGSFLIAAKTMSCEYDSRLEIGSYDEQIYSGGVPSGSPTGRTTYLHMGWPIYELSGSGNYGGSCDFLVEKDYVCLKYSWPYRYYDYFGVSSLPAGQPDVFANNSAFLVSGGIFGRTPFSEVGGAYEQTRSAISASAPAVHPTERGTVDFEMVVP